MRKYCLTLINISHPLTICSWKFVFLLAFDANFKQKARVRANDSKDPPLAPGCGVQVNPDLFEKYLGDTGGIQDEVNISIKFSEVLMVP